MLLAGRGVLQRGHAERWRWIVDARKGDARRCIVESDELLSAFLKLEAMVAVGGHLLQSHISISRFLLAAARVGSPLGYPGSANRPTDA